MGSLASVAVPESPASLEESIARRPRFRREQGDGSHARPIERVRVSVIIPTLNEAENLPHVFSRLPDGLHEVIVVDGHSTDGCRASSQRS